MSAASESPSRSEQESFWNEWNSQHRTAEIDHFMQRQRDVAMRWAESRTTPRILEIGCGTGWLADALSARGSVVAIDMAPAAIDFARRRYPNVEFYCGDFSSVELPGPFDLIVTADVIGHVEDHTQFVRRAAELLVHDGVLVIMTQNPFVWLRSSYLRERGRGQIRNWPSLRDLRVLLAPEFKVVHVSSIVPGGDRGILRVINSKYVAGVIRRLFGRARATRLFERLLVGRELVVVARKR